MIIVRLSGGLGNQMFQYATGRSIAINQGCELYIDPSFFDKSVLRRFSLNNMNIKVKYASKTELDFFKPNYLQSLLRKIGLAQSAEYIIDREEGYNEGLKSLKNSKHYYFEGCWQSYKYFEEFREYLLEDFVPIHEPSDHDKKVLGFINAHNTCSLHVRRGDYVSNTKTNTVHGTCGVEYYHRAIEMLLSKYQDLKFVVFSDDIVWAKENLILNDQALFVDHNNSDTAHLDLMLMSSCNHNIIANSTFSWWGAWLNTNQNKVVCCPRNWFADEKFQIKAVHLLPCEWTKL